ncbi:hypothetical protein Tco_0506635 [Tanacetum coccineum]
MEAELRESRAQIDKLQRKQMENNNKIALARFRIANLEQIIEDIQVRQQADMESTDIAKITRKRSKPGKYEHENGYSAQEPRVSNLGQQSQPWSTIGQPQKDKTHKTLNE